MMMTMAEEEDRGEEEDGGRCWGAVVLLDASNEEFEGRARKVWSVGTVGSGGYFSSIISRSERTVRKEGNNLIPRKMLLDTQRDRSSARIGVAGVNFKTSRLARDAVAKMFVEFCSQIPGCSCLRL
jgi:hypothetical protein